MRIVNGPFTIIAGVRCAIETMRYDDCHVALVYEGNHPPEAGFVASPSEPGVYRKEVDINSLPNAYLVSTFALYKQECVQLFGRPAGYSTPDIVTIATRSSAVGRRLDMVEMRPDWFTKDISTRDIEKIWVENSPYPLCDKMPEGLARIEARDLRTLS